MGASALEGIRVLELSHGLAARSAGALLADLGAEVVLFPAGGFPAGPDALLSEDPALVWADRREIRGAELRELVDGADIVLSDLQPGRLERLGLDAVTVGEQNPSAVHVWMPPFGTAG